MPDGIKTVKSQAINFSVCLARERNVSIGISSAIGSTIFFQILVRYAFVFFFANKNYQVLLEAARASIKSYLLKKRNS